MIWMVGFESFGYSYLFGSGLVEIGELVDGGKENVIKVVDLFNEVELNGVISKDLY